MVYDYNDPSTPAPKTRKQAIQLSIDHWERMIDFAKSWDPDDKHMFTSDDMKQAIGESCTGSFCALCMYYEDDCTDNCPLGAGDPDSTTDSTTDCNDAGSLYRNVVTSRNPEDWVANAHILVDRLVDALNEVK